MDNLEFVDRYNYDHVKKHFKDVMPGDLPKFGKVRYSFRKGSTVAGDVVFSEPIEVQDVLHVEAGGKLQSLIDNSDAPMRGKGVIVVKSGGMYSAGVKATYDHRTRVEVHSGGTFRVPRYSTIQLMKDKADISIMKGAEMVVDGKLVLVGDMLGNGIRQCGLLRGPGSIIGNGVETWNATCSAGT